MANILDKSERLKTEDNPGLYVMRIFHDYYKEISGLKPNDLKDEKSIKDLSNNYLSNVMCLMDFIDLKNREYFKQREKSSKLLEQVHDLKGQLENKLSSVKTTNIKSIKKRGIGCRAICKIPIQEPDRCKNRRKFRCCQCSLFYVG